MPVGDAVGSAHGSTALDGEGFAGGGRRGAGLRFAAALPRGTVERLLGLGGMSFGAFFFLLGRGRLRPQFLRTS